MSHFPKINLKFHQAGMRAAQTGRTLASVIEEAASVAEGRTEGKPPADFEPEDYRSAESKSFSLIIGWVDGAFSSIRR